ncbi:MAG: polysaccharide biosynthesis protein [Coriobacteriia bacterium]|nr:polysaccharide biosynthesis protein [Coriobacteriia bacterium]
MQKPFEGKKVLVTGGTGSLGQALVGHILSGIEGTPKSVTVLSRDEAKQHDMRLEYAGRSIATDEVIFESSRQYLRFIIGDVRDYDSVLRAAADADIIFAAAALKQVPSCEYFPWEACRTNIEGAENLVRAIAQHKLSVETVVGISTDKACKPVNVMGMTKAIQERIYIEGNLRAPQTRFVAARYGNVLASRGSVLPLFVDQIVAGGPVTVTTQDMTRFLLPLDAAVDTVIAALKFASPGETYIPQCSSARMINLASTLIGDRDIEIALTGIRPGEKVHESLLSAEEAARTVAGTDGYYAMRSLLPELAELVVNPVLVGDYSSDKVLMTAEELQKFLARWNIAIEKF